MSVDLPSSTLPQVLKRRMSTGSWAGPAWAAGVEAGDGEVSTDILEIPRLLAVLHGGLGGLVIGAGAALGDAGGGNLGDDVVDGIGRALDHAGADHVGDGADAADHGLDGFGRFRPGAGVGIGLRR